MGLFAVIFYALNHECILAGSRVMTDELKTDKSNTDELKTYSGSCHCGAVRFEVQVTADERVVEDCNCSICRKKGFLHLILSPDRFTLLSGQDSLITYTFNTHTAQHRFCKHCGIHAFYTPRSHPDKIDVNVRCLDGDVLQEFTIVPFDGQNWEANIEILKTRKP